MSLLTARSTGARAVRLKLPRSALLTLITTHIALSVGLLGDSAGFLAVAIRDTTSDDEAFHRTAHDILAMFATTFGIPLSFLALLSGLVLALSTPWGVFRYSWVVAKLALIASVIVVGATLISPVIQPDGQPNHLTLIAASAWDVLALTAATALAVVKPGKQGRSRKATAKPVALRTERP